MNKEELKYKISELLPEIVGDDSSEFLTFTIPSGQLLSIMKSLYTKKEFDFDYLFCLTCIDWKDHLMMVYHLLSKSNNHTVVIKAKITDTNNPEIESVNSFWKTAELHENEVFDLFGVKFLNHPNLRRMFLEEDWVGYPLRKNYADDNMIKL